MLALQILFSIFVSYQSEQALASTEDAQSFSLPGEMTKLRSSESLKSGESEMAEPLYVDGFDVDFENQIIHAQKMQDTKEELNRWNYDELNRRKY